MHQLSELFRWFTHRCFARFLENFQILVAALKIKNLNTSQITSLSPRVCVPLIIDRLCNETFIGTVCLFMLCYYVLIICSDETRCIYVMSGVRGIVVIQSAISIGMNYAWGETLTHRTAVWFHNNFCLIFIFTSDIRESINALLGLQTHGGNLLGHQLKFYELFMSFRSHSRKSFRKSFLFRFYGKWWDVLSHSCTSW